MRAFPRSPELQGYRSTRSNPCHRLAKFPERKMERFLEAEERARLDAVLAEGEAYPLGHPRHIGAATVLAARLLLMTGARLGEIVGLRWSMVDIERSCLRLPDSKTGANSIPISPQTAAVLAKLAEAMPPGDAFVCPGKREGMPLQNFRRSWISIRKRAGLDDVRIHDIRHSAATDMLAAGMSLPEVSVVLGHKSTQTTARYGHWADRTRRDIARRMGDAIERRSREGAERLQQQRAVGAEGVDGAEDKTIPVDGAARVIRLRPRGKR